MSSLERTPMSNPPSEDQVVKEKEPSKNSFVDFIYTNQEQLDIFTSRGKEIKQKERDINESTEITELTVEGIPLILRNPTVHGVRASRFKTHDFDHPDNPEVREIRNQIIEIILNKKGVKEDQLPPPKNEFERERNAWMMRINKMAFAHEEEVHPLEEDLHKATDELNRKFFSHLMTSADNLYQFSVFLSDEQYRSAREGVRPFLVNLANREMSLKRNTNGKTTSLIDQAVEAWVSQLGENPMEEDLSNFVENKLRFGSSKQNAFDLRSHLEFGREMVKKRHPALQLKNLGEMMAEEIVREEMPEYEDWPEQLRKEFDMFLRHEFSLIVVRAKENLREFRSIETKSNGEILASGFSDKLPHRKARHESPQTQVFPENRKTPEPISNEKKLAIFREGEDSRKGTTEMVSEEERKERLTDQVEEKYKNSEAIIEGLDKVINALLHEDPKKLGANKTAPMQVVNLDGNPFAIWNIVPKIKSQIALPASFPRDAHILFAIDNSKSDGPNLVFMGMGDELWYKKVLGLRSLKNTKYRKKR